MLTFEYSTILMPERSVMLHAAEAARDYRTLVSHCYNMISTDVKTHTDRLIKRQPNDNKQCLLSKGSPKDDPVSLLQKGLNHINFRRYLGLKISHKGNNHHNDNFSCAHQAHPRMILSVFSRRDSITPILDDTLEPPTMATKGLLGSLTAPSR